MVFRNLPVGLVLLAAFSLPAQAENLEEAVASHLNQQHNSDVKSGSIKHSDSKGPAKAPARGPASSKGASAKAAIVVSKAPKPKGHKVKLNPKVIVKKPHGHA